MAGKAVVSLVLGLDVLAEEVVGIGCEMEGGCWVVGEALKLEFLLLMAEKSTKSSLLDSSCSSFGNK